MRESVIFYSNQQGTIRRIDIIDIENQILQQRYSTKSTKRELTILIRLRWQVIVLCSF